jgi:hypothetical protein
MTRGDENQKRELTEMRTDGARHCKLPFETYRDCQL